MAANADEVIAKLAAQAAGSQRAATASENLEAAIAAEQAALAGLGGSLDAARAKMAAMQAEASVNVNAYRKQAEAIKQLEAAQAAQAARAEKLSGARGAIAAAEAQTAAQKKAAEAQKQAAQEAEKAATHTAMLAQVQRDNAAAADVSGASMTNALSALKAAGPEGYIVAAALMAVTVGFTGVVAAMIAGGAAAIEVTEKLSKLRTVLDALGGGAAGGAAAMKVVQDLARSLPFATDQVATWAKSLMAAGFQGAALKSAIEAVAAATALMGEQGGAAAEKMLKTLQEGGDAAEKLIKVVQQGGRKAATALADMGLQTADLAAALGVSEAQFKKMHLSAEQLQKAIETALKKKGEGPLAEMALTFPVMIQKLKEGFFSLFAKLGPAIKPFMQAVQSLFGQFGKGSSIMGALGKVATEAFTFIFKYATLAVQAVSKFVRENLTAKNIGSVWESIKGTIAGVAKFLGMFWNFLKPLLASPQALKGFATIFKIIGAVILVVIAVITTLVTLVTGMIGLFAGAIGTIAGFATSAIGAFLDVANVAGSFGASIVEGLANLDFGAFVAKMKAMAMAGLNAFKAALGIASPSKVMMQMGGHLATGVAEGVDDGAPKAQAATAKLVDPKALKVGKGGASGAGKTVVFEDCTFGSVTETQIREWTLKALDEDGFAGPEAAPA